MGMQQARSSFLFSLRSVAGSIFSLSPEYLAAKYQRAAMQQIMDMIGWVAGKEYDVLKAPVLYPDHVINDKKVFGNWLVIAKVRSPKQLKRVFANFRVV